LTASDDGYDMDIVLESKDTRKKTHQLGRKYVDGLSVDYPDDQGK